MGKEQKEKGDRRKNLADREKGQMCCKIVTLISSCIMCNILVIMV